MMTLIRMSTPISDDIDVDDDIWGFFIGDPSPSIIRAVSGRVLVEANYGVL